jgi:hypothetical protein
MKSTTRIISLFSPPPPPSSKHIPFHALFRPISNLTRPLLEFLNIDFLVLDGLVKSRRRGVCGFRTRQGRAEFF